MEKTLVELLVITGLFLILAIPAYLAFGEDSQGPQEPPISLSDLPSHMVMQGNGQWEVTILRRSGYGHDAWVFTGSAVGALHTAQQKMRQARIEECAIRANSASRFDVRAYYESIGKRRTGKYVGGFVISRV